jgi:hypothetical protein
MLLKLYSNLFWKFLNQHEELSMWRAFAGASVDCGKELVTYCPLMLFALLIHGAHCNYIAYDNTEYLVKYIDPILGLKTNPVWIKMNSPTFK